MSPLLSISIISFYLSLLISLVLYFQVIKKSQKYEFTAFLGIFTASTVGSLLLVNMYALKLIVSALPVALYGIILDKSNEKEKPLLTCLALTLSSLILYAFRFNLVAISTIFLTACILNLIIKPSQHNSLTYTLLFTVLALTSKNNAYQLKFSTLLAVSNLANVFLSYPKPKIRYGKSSLYPLNFLLSGVLIQLILKT